MISLIISLLPFIFIIYYFHLTRNRDIVLWDMKHGHRCISCLEKNETAEPYWLSKEHQYVCKKCDRDNSLNFLLGNKRDKIRMRFISVAISKQWDKWYYSLLGGALLLALVSAILGLFIDRRYMSVGHVNFSDISNFINCIVWTAMIIRLRFISIPCTKGEECLHKK